MSKKLNKNKNRLFRIGINLLGEVQIREVEYSNVSQRERMSLLSYFALQNLLKALKTVLK